jgi:hypothetical protein
MSGSQMSNKLGKRPTPAKGKGKGKPVVKKSKKSKGY